MHVDGRYIKNETNNTIFLRGVVKHGFEDDPRAHWTANDGIVRWSTFDPVVVGDNLDEMKKWGSNVVRIYGTVEFWVNNTENHREIIKQLATMCADRGMYLIYSFWHILKTAPQTSLPFPPYCENNSYINNQSDFANFWRSVAQELKDYNNILFELWNEPHGDDTAKTKWFSAVQQCINEIRNTGATNLILVQWDYGIWSSLQFPPPTNPAGTLSWIEEYPLTDCKNL